LYNHMCASHRYTFWSSDFHISPIADLKDLFVPMGMKVIDKSLSAHCKLMGTCAKDLKVKAVVTCSLCDQTAFIWSFGL
jgi:hypothetical protein